MDDAVALVMAAPVIALALWAVTFAGGQSNSGARAAVAAEAAALAAVDSGHEAAARIALGATLAACTRTDTVLIHHEPAVSAAVTIVCRVPGPLTHNQVCITGYAQAQPATTGHVPVSCPAPLEG